MGSRCSESLRAVHSILRAALEQMLLGSDVLVFKSKEHPRMSLHLRSGDFNDIEPLACLDLWLDNVMADVPEMVLAAHCS